MPYYLVEYDDTRNGSSGCCVSDTSEYYCNECFDIIFTTNEQENIPPTATKAHDQLLLDGVHHEAVLNAANQLHSGPPAEEASPTSFLDKYGCPDHAFNWSSNSPQNRARREFKHYETELTLAEVGKYEKANQEEREQHLKAHIREPSPEATVLIIRPTYMEPREDRYKKQGLTQYDREKYSKEKKRNEVTNDTQPITPLASLAKASIHLQERLCSCRELDDGTEMLECSAELCPVGWFHLRCTGLDRLPTTHEQFFCCYCSDGIDAFVIKRTLDEDLDVFTEPNTPAAVGYVTSDAPEQNSESGRDTHEEEHDASNVIHLLGSMVESPRSSAMINRWSVVNGTNIGWARTRSVDLSEDETYTSSSTLSDLPPTSEEEIRDASASDDGGSATTHSPATTLSAKIPDLTPDNHFASRDTTAAPMTLPMQPVRLATIPWGTPTNLNKIDIFDQLSPSSTQKRKREAVQEEVEDGIRLDEEIPDSEEEGEEVPLMLDTQVLRDCNR